MRPLPCDRSADTGKATLELALHGGGDDGATMENGIENIVQALPSGTYEFVTPDAPYLVGDGRLWVEDPPGGKDAPTVSPDVANESMALLDRFVATEGPFWGIMGYSQGSAFATVYTAARPGTFNVSMLFCGYLTETHLGLLGIVDNASPFGNIPALVWMGTADPIITNAETTAQADKYHHPTIMTAQGLGHAVPRSGEPTFAEVVAWIENPTQNPTQNPTSGSSAGTSTTLIVAVAVYVVVKALVINMCVFVRMDIDGCVERLFRVMRLC